ncbi:glutamate ligase domain-containing protein [Streptomyces jumonjinensis]|uniref:glutamate ligase domain-containing protein n=1 Tax=Streptomyces jumonjinensis TaxID=1945 RepID=UPI0037A800F0
MCRQCVEPDEWIRHGGDELGDRIEWSDRACGMAALRMILLAYGCEAPQVTDLLKTGVEKGILVDRGWVHQGIGDLAGSFGVPGRAEVVPADELIARLADAPVIISVTEQFPDDGRRGGHLVVARGFEDEEGSDPVILIRDPSGWGQTHDRVPLSRLIRSYSGRAVTFPPLHQGGRRIAVLGEMAELGEAAATSHREVGQMAAEYGVDLLVAVGDAMAKQMALAAVEAGVPEVAIVRDNATAVTLIESRLRPGDIVLTKASRSGMLWQVAQALKSESLTGY